MMIDATLVYADSSALVKLVVEETETWALEAFVADRTVVTSRLAVVEVLRAARIKNHGAGEATAREVLDKCTLIDITASVVDRASDLASASLRALDAIHLASCETAGSPALIAYDRRLLAAASELDLETASPGAT